MRHLLFFLLSLRAFAGQSIVLNSGTVGGSAVDPATQQSVSRRMEMEIHNFVPPGVSNTNFVELDGFSIQMFVTPSGQYGFQSGSATMGIPCFVQSGPGPDLVRAQIDGELS